MGVPDMRIPIQYALTYPERLPGPAPELDFTALKHLSFDVADEETCLLYTSPYIDNWATCDLPSPRIFARHKEELLPYVRRWMASDQTYTCLLYTSRCV